MFFYIVLERMRQHSSGIEESEYIARNGVRTIRAAGEKVWGTFARGCQLDKATTCTEFVEFESHSSLETTVEQTTDAKVTDS